MEARRRCFTPAEALDVPETARSHWQRDEPGILWCRITSWYSACYSVLYCIILHHSWLLEDIKKKRFLNWKMVIWLLELQLTRGLLRSSRSLLLVSPHNILYFDIHSFIYIVADISIDISSRTVYIKQGFRDNRVMYRKLFCSLHFNARQNIYLKRVSSMLIEYFVCVVWMWPALCRGKNRKRKKERKKDTFCKHVSKRVCLEWLITCSVYILDSEGWGRGKKKMGVSEEKKFDPIHSTALDQHWSLCDTNALPVCLRRRHTKVILRAWVVIYKDISIMTVSYKVNQTYRDNFSLVTFVGKFLTIESKDIVF